jgi:hypothetical protein
MNPSLIQLHHATAYQAELPARDPVAPPLRSEPTMTLLATTAPRRPASRAYVVPVVREVAPQPRVAGSSAW